MYIIKVNEILPKGFFSVVREVITPEEALKDVIPVDWDYALKDWVEDESQVIKTINKMNKYYQELL